MMLLSYWNELLKWTCVYKLKSAMFLCEVIPLPCSWKWQCHVSHGLGPQKCVKCQATFPLKDDYSIHVTIRGKSANLEPDTCKKSLKRLISIDLMDDIHICIPQYSTSGILYVCFLGQHVYRCAHDMSHSVKACTYWFYDLIQGFSSLIKSNLPVINVRIIPDWLHASVTGSVTR